MGGDLLPSSPVPGVEVVVEVEGFSIIIGPAANNGEKPTDNMTAIIRNKTVGMTANGETGLLVFKINQIYNEP